MASYKDDSLQVVSVHLVGTKCV